MDYVRVRSTFVFNDVFVSCTCRKMTYHDSISSNSQIPIDDLNFAIVSMQIII